MSRNIYTDASSLLRRTFVRTAGASVLAPTRMRSATLELRAIAFDAFPLFDPRTIAAHVRAVFPNDGERLAAAWSSKLFGNTWFATAANHYIPFDVLADASLRSAATSLNILLSDSARVDLLSQYHKLEVWEDVAPTLNILMRSGLKLVVLSNLGEKALRQNLNRAGLTPFFAAVLSTDRVHRFKPAAAAYAMATDALCLPKSDIGFAAFGGWDAVGATWFGYRTAWINRGNVPGEALDVEPEIVTSGMEGVLKLAGLK